MQTKKDIQRLKFGDRQNSIDVAISTGVELHNVPGPDTLQNIIQYEIIVEDYRNEEPAGHPETICNEIIDEVGEVDEVIPGSEDNIAGTSDSGDETINEVSTENKVDKIVTSDETNLNAQTFKSVFTVTRSRKTRKPCDRARNFPETDCFKMDSTEDRWIRPCYHDSII